MAKLVCNATGVVVDVQDEKAAQRMLKSGFSQQAAAKPAAKPAATKPKAKK